MWKYGFEKTEICNENQTEISNELSKIYAELDNISNMITKQNQKSDENITKITQLIKLDNDNLKKQITSVNDPKKIGWYSKLMTILF